MALLELIGRLGLNTSPFESGLKRAKNAARSESAEIGRVFRNVGLGLLGINSISRTLQQTINQTIAWSKDIDKTREEFKRLGVTIDEDVLKTIKQTGIEMERLKAQTAITVAPAVGAAAEIFSRAAAGMAMVMNALFHPFGKRGEMNAKLEQDIQDRADAIFGPGSSLKEQEDYSKERQKKLDAMESVKKASELNLRPASTGREVQDSLARIGGFTQRSFVPNEGPMRQLVMSSQKTADNSQRIAEFMAQFRGTMLGGFYHESEF
jgi:hypothetical protein